MLVYNPFVFLIECRFHAKVGDYWSIHSDKCGLNESSNNVTVVSNRIIDGQSTRLGEFPWIVSVQIRRQSGDEFIDSYCAGALINTKWVLTVATCLQNIDLTIDVIQMFIGSNHRQLGDTYYAQNITIYNNKNNTRMLDNDIAIIKLSHKFAPLVFNDKNRYYFKVNTICLPKANITNVNREPAIFSGWGAIVKEGTNMTDNLKKAEYLIDNNYKQCNNNNICVNENWYIPCFGDSGSPLIQYDGERAVLIGLFSHSVPTNTGNSTIDNQCHPGWQYFTRVSYYVDWIIDTINTIEYHDNEELSNKKLTQQRPNVLLVIVIFLIIVSLSLIAVILAIKFKSDSERE
ncbi:venom peptide isomerase heavy chain-like [Oppia nitens]|uniref:venom peptide isomerase heavy chain-like n=1 Tax=Oppia nitens TaxID=1686743 RepID=UPI0023DCB4B7|nr:venom peptide isomerase heavy chain-like [Oppia nitens]